MVTLFYQTAIDHVYFYEIEFAELIIRYLPAGSVPHSISASYAAPPSITATIVAGELAEIECANSKKRRLGITPKTALFCCGSEHTLYNISVLEYNAKLEKKPRMRPQ